MQDKSTLTVAGISYRRTPIELREQLAIATGELGAEVRGLATHFPGMELVLVATCNRVECYAVSSDPALDAASVIARLATSRAVDASALPTYLHRGSAAVRHLFLVAAGLDSMVVGEDQILGQLKEAYLSARQAGTTGKVLNATLQEAFRVGKSVRTETRINEGRVSVGSVAVGFARRVFSDLGDKTALVLGAGETAELVVGHLYEHGLRELLVANRSPERGSALVQRFGGQWLALSDIERHLHRADIVIGSTASSRPIVDVELARRSLSARRNTPALLLDLAVPRDIDPRITELPGAFLYDIDDLQEVVVENLGKREAEVVAARAIVDRMTATFERTLATFDVEPLIGELRRRAEAVRMEEIGALFARLELDPDARLQIERTARRIVNRLLHEPTSGIRAVEPERDYRPVEVFRALFDLNDDDE